MAFTIEPVKHEDLDEFIKVWYDSFEPLVADQVLPQIYPGGFTPELQKRLRDRVFGGTNGDTTEYCFCAREKGTDKIVGVSWWSTLTKPNAAALAEDTNTAGQDLDTMLKSKNSGSPIAKMNTQLGDAFYTAMFEAEKAVIKPKGVPYIGLNVLAVLPEYERRGIGGSLLRQGLQKVDSVNVWTFLIASKTGRGLYLKNDFEVAQELDFDATKYGGRSKAPHCVMIRPAQNAST